jgi:hypothetical protein
MVVPAGPLNRFFRKGPTTVPGRNPTMPVQPFARGCAIILLNSFTFFLQGKILFPHVAVSTSEQRFGILNPNPNHGSDRASAHANSDHEHATGH